MEGTKMRKRTGISLLLVALILLVQVVTVEAANSNPNVAPINSSAYGKTYGDWSAAWWQWIFAQTSATNPFSATDCATTPQPANQKVVFLVGTGGGETRTCTVSPGTPLFFPLINGINFDYYPSGINDPVGDTPATWLKDFKIYFAPQNVVLNASLDGVPLKDLKTYQVFSDPFFANLVPGNIFGIPGGLVEGLNAGYFLMLHPLSPGTHVIQFSASTLSGVHESTPGIFDFDPFSISSTYLITVKPGSK